MKRKATSLACPLMLLGILFEPSQGMGCSAEIVASKTVDLSGYPGDCGEVAEAITPAPSAVCALKFDGVHQGDATGELTQKENGVWIFKAASCRPGMWAKITCYAIH